LIAAAVLAACSPESSASSQAPATVPKVEDGSQQGLREVPLVIHSSNGDHRFTVEVAETPDQQQMGLMFRGELSPYHGMIFPFAQERVATFWMKNTVIPLDMIFIRKDGTIAAVATAQPLTLDLVSAYEPVSSVLEIAGGRAAELGIAEGDRVEVAL
jgi:uncharacterized membrane protein (UPF0127 family)